MSRLLYTLWNIMRFRHERIADPQITEGVVVYLVTSYVVTWSDCSRRQIWDLYELTTNAESVDSGNCTTIAVYRCTHLVDLPITPSSHASDYFSVTSKRRGKQGAKFGGFSFEIVV